MPDLILNDGALASSPAEGIDLAEAREIVRRSALVSSAATYGDERVDRAIQFALGMAHRRTRAVVSLTDIALENGVDVVTPEDGSMAEQFLSAWIDEYEVKRRDFTGIQILRQRRERKGQPELLAFQTSQRLHLWPSPDQAYTLSIKVWRPLTSWIPGTANPEGITLNTPVSWVRDALWWGASAALVHADPDEVMQTLAWRRFEQLMFEIRGQDPDVGVWDPDPREYV